MLAPGTGIPLKQIKVKAPSGKGEEVKQCFSGTKPNQSKYNSILLFIFFSGKVGIDWILSVMPRIKHRNDCLHIAQQLVDKQLILPIKPNKNKTKFVDDESILYYFTV